MLETHTLVWHQHNGFSGQVEGNERAINALRGLIVPNLLVKSFIIYKRLPGEVPQLERLESVNYTALKELRKNA